MKKENEAYIVKVATCEDELAAKTISKWTSESGTTLPKSEEELLRLFAQGISALVYNMDGLLVGHSSTPYLWEDSVKGKFAENGATYVSPEHRRKGVASAAVQTAITITKEKYPDHTIFGLCTNTASINMIKKLGGEKMKYDELPDEVWEPCQTCPQHDSLPEGQSCCATPFKLYQKGGEHEEEE